MSALPNALKPWAPYLGVLQQDLALALGPWIQRLSLSIGPLSDAESRPMGAPDGYDGVSRKGSYERLLASEWLYADEMPDEFLRRAAEGEHLFSRLAVREPHHARQCLVLFDSGPSQLGTPRIAHLAALVSFAARCDAVQAKLHWGIAQAPGHVQSGFDKERARTLLQSRTTKEPTNDDLERWLERFHTEADDIWLVGGSTTCALPASSRMQSLVVSEELEPGVRRLEVAVRRAARVRRQIQLELPTAQLCTALLRSPFTVDAPKEQKPGPSRPTKGLVFSANGNRLFTLGPRGELLVITIPTAWSRDESETKQVVFQPPVGEVLVAAGWHKGLVAVTRRSDAGSRVIRFAVWSLTKRGASRESPRFFDVPPEIADVTPGMALQGLSDLTVLNFSGTKRLLFALGHMHFMLEYGPSDVRRTSLLPYSPIAHSQRPERALFLTVDYEGRRHLRTLYANGREGNRVLEGLGLCVGFLSAANSEPLVALGDTPTSSRWIVLFPHNETVGIEIPEAGTVVGVTGVAPSFPAGLLLRTKERLLHVSTTETRVVAELEHPIVAFTSDFDRARVAWLESSGTVGAFDPCAPEHFLLGKPDAHRMHFIRVQR